jgi:hypothetical protein
MKFLWELELSWEQEIGLPCHFGQEKSVGLPCHFGQEKSEGREVVSQAVGTF